MRRSTIVILIVSACLIVGGLLLAGGAWAISGGNIGITLYWEGDALRVITPNSTGGGMQSHEIELDSVERIDLDVGESDVILQPGDCASLRYNWYSPITAEPEWSLQDGCLTVRQEKRELYSFVMHWAPVPDTPVVLITYPQDSTLQSVTLHCDNGSIDLSQLRVQEDLKITIDYGSITLSQVQAGDVILQTDSGDCRAQGLEAQSVVYEADFGSGQFADVKTASFSAECDSGDLNVENSGLGSARFSLDFGQLNLQSCEAADLQAQNRSGEMSLQGTYTGDIQLISDFGPIRFETSLPKEEYSYQANLSLGDLTVNGEHNAPSCSELQSAFHRLDIQSDCGSVELWFGK
jgi:hypothetical protein